METIDCKEIYYASTEHSAISGYAGFGVRTYTKGMRPDEVTEIVDKCAPGYSVEADRMLTFEQISSNPRVVYDYAPAYSFRRVELAAGGSRYVLSRTVYIGIDYGYFCDRNGAMRTGANYFAHLLVFDELPPVGVFAMIGNEDLFFPRDYTCYPGNAELQSLLTGEPQLLPPRSLRCGSGEIAAAVAADLARCVTALLQAYANGKRGTDPSLCKVIIKAPESTTQALVKSLSVLPVGLIAGKRFTTNYMQGYGVPDEYDMVFVNEHNERELYEDSHVCVNLFEGTTRNVDDNFIYRKIVELAAGGDTATMMQLVDYYLRLDPAKEHDYAFEYNMFLVAETSKEVSLDDLSGEFIAKACALRLAPEAEARLWDKINAAVNRGLTSSRGLEINKAIAVAGYILQSDGQRLQLTPESSKWITCTILFGSPSYLGKVVNSSNIDVVLYITDRGLIPSEDSFFDALNQSHSTTVWRKMLRYYYDDINDNIGIIINRIMQWPVPPEARHELIGELFPVERCGNALYGYILAHTEQISDLKEMVRAVCLRADKERFSAILKQSGNDAVVAGVLAPIVAEYYAGMVSHDPRNGIKALLEFIDEVTVPVFNGMEAARRVFDVYADACMKNPAGCDRDVLGRLLPPSEIAVGHEAAAKIATVASLMDGNVPSMVDCSVLLMAHRMGKDAGYIRQLYEAWLKLSPSRKEVAAYASQAAGMAAACVAGIISATWESQVQAIRADRENYVLAIADNVKWNSTDRKAFIASCPDKALAKHLAGADKFFTKLTRKLFNRS